MSGSRRQLVFFVVALLVPSALMLGSGIVLLQQDAELELRREADRRSLVSRAWTDSLFAQLENAYAQSERPRGRYVTGWPLLSLGEHIDGQKRLAGSPPGDSPLLARSLQNFLLETTRMEVADGRPGEAARQYRRRADSTPNPTSYAFLKLREARALDRAGRVVDARRAAMEALAAPDSIVDEFGTPIAFYAADRLLADSRVADVNERLAKSPEGWLTPPALGMLGNLGRTDSLSLLEHRLLESLKGRNLVKGPSPESPRWVADPSGKWLIRLVDGGRVEPEHLVAIAIDSLAGLLPSDALLKDFRAGSEATLGLPFRGLAASVTTPESASVPRRILLAGGALAFLTLALLAGVFLWRDVRRESRLAELRSQFVSSVSHELRTPLTSIRLYAESMRAFGNDDLEERNKDLEVIASESDRLTRMLDNVLSTSRIERGTMRYRFELGDVSEPVERASRSMTYVFKQEGVPLSVATESVWTQMDADAVEQAVINLLSNALKYGGGQPVDLVCRQEDVYARIEVRDRGPGIEPEAKERIFERFHREASVISQNIPGAGLGLSLVRHIVEAHDGSVQIDSAPPDGSSFSLLLPIREI